MTEKELWDALDGLMAYDLGATDSGIHDEGLRERVKAHLALLDTAAEKRRQARVASGERYAMEKGASLTLSRFIRERMLSDDALATGYSIEDVKEFIDWLRSEMDYHI